MYSIQQKKKVADYARMHEVRPAMEMVKQHARAVVSQVNPAFRASDGWAHKFMRRHNLVFRARTSMAQKQPGHLESKVAAFREQVQSIRDRTNIDFWKHG